jgi:hypothetical protein
MQRRGEGWEGSNGQGRQAGEGNIIFMSFYFVNFSNLTFFRLFVFQKEKKTKEAVREGKVQSWRGGMGKSGERSLLQSGTLGR